MHGPVQASEWKLLGMHWRDNLYVDTCVPFDLRFAPATSLTFHGIELKSLVVNSSADDVIEAVASGNKILHHPPLAILLGYHPQPRCPEVSKGKRGNGPRTLPACTTMSSSASTASGCASTEARLCA